MLFNPNWKPEVKADPFKLESLIAWLEKQPAKRRYCYHDAGRCLLAQWFKSCGQREVYLGNETVAFGDGVTLRTHRLPQTFQRIATGHPWTFGAALDRARQFAKSAA